MISDTRSMLLENDIDHKNQHIKLSQSRVETSYPFEEEAMPYYDTPLAGSFHDGDEMRAFSKLDLKFIDKLKPLIRFIKLLYRYETLYTDNMPDGPCLVIGNHTFATFEGVISMFNRMEKTGKWDVAGIMDKEWFRLPIVRDIIIKLGMIHGERSIVIDALNRGLKVGILLGGPSEAYKSSDEQYRINWTNRHGRPKLGFIKCALKAQVPIVPMVHVGSEEMFHVSKLKTGFFKRNNISKYEFPFAVFKPFPYKVYELFGPPIYLDYPAEAADNEDVLLKCFMKVKTEYLALMHHGLALKRENARSFTRELLNTENQRLVEALRPYF